MLEIVADAFVILLLAVVAVSGTVLLYVGLRARVYVADRRSAHRPPYRGKRFDEADYSHARAQGVSSK